MPHKRKDLNITGPNLWYLVGLITTDGSLSVDGRNIDITSADYEFLQKIKSSLGISNKIGNKYNSKKQKFFRIQIANRNFYDFLLSIGLRRKKTFTLSAIRVPDQYFTDFLRGVIDGDGCIRRWIHPSNYREQWSLRIYSGSASYVKWLQESIERTVRVKGRMHRDKRKKPRKDLFILKFGKVAARHILNRCYYKNSISLERKARLAQECVNSYLGWERSKTVLNQNFSPGWRNSVYATDLKSVGA